MNWDKIDLFNPTEEHLLLRKTVRSFVQKEVEPQALAHDRDERFNVDLFRRLGDLGLHGITVSETYGGAGLGALAAVIAHEELSASDPGLCLAYLAHAMLCINNIAVNASDEQRARVLPDLCSGAAIGAMGMSEAGAGTDVLGMTTTAEPVENGYRLNGRKMWITNGCIDEGTTPCDVLLLYARMPVNQGDRPKVSTFLIEKGMPGFTVGQKIRDKLGMRASNTAELCFDDCILPVTALVGEEGDSIAHMMRNLELERVTLAAMAVGIARRSLEVMTHYANDRSAFGKKIAAFGQIQAHIAESYAEYNAARSYVYNVARCLDLKTEGNRMASDGVKLFATPVAKRIADRAIQVLGGNGYVAEYVVERLWRDAKLLEIGGGTLESHHKNITKDLIKAL